MSENQHTYSKITFNSSFFFFSLRLRFPAPFFNSPILLFIIISAYLSLYSFIFFQDGVAADRRCRLDALRNRMTNEFGSGHTLLNAGDGYTDDDAGSASESSSLASWGRNLLMQAPYMKMKLVYPADTISTKAFSNHQNLNR